MTEYRFMFEPPTRLGRTVFSVVNAGTERHWFGMYRLPGDLPALDAQLHGEERRPLGPSMASMAVTEPGQRNLFAVELVPGVRYAFLCLLSAPDGESHALKGMNAEFRLPPVVGKAHAPGT